MGYNGQKGNEKNNIHDHCGRLFDGIPVICLAQTAIITIIRKPSKNRKPLHRWQL